MPVLDTLRDFFQRRQVARLDALTNGVQLVNLRSESPRGNFVFPVSTTWTTSRSIGKAWAWSITASTPWAIGCIST